MNGGASNGEGSEYCQQVVTALQNTLRQANATYFTLRNLLDNFVRQQYSSQTKEVQEMWKLHKLDLLHPYRGELEDDIDQIPSDQHYAHILGKPINKALISAELVKVYTTLAMLDEVFTKLTETRSANRSQLLHDYGQERLKEIDTFFADAARHVRIDLAETKQAMATLGIAEPELIKPVTYNEATSAKEWLIATEHLKVVQYLRQLYEILLKQCPATQ